MELRFERKTIVDPSGDQIGVASVCGLDVRGAGLPRARSITQRSGPRASIDSRKRQTRLIR